MPSASQHKDQAARNRALAEDLIREGGPDRLAWAVTILFYSALHRVDQLLAPEDPGRHSRRYRLMDQQDPLNTVMDEYRHLKKHSEAARYRCIPFTEQEIQDDVLPLLNKIEDVVDTY